MNYKINISNIENKSIYDISQFKCKNINGETLSFTNYYIKKNDMPFFGISGEFHFSRCDDKYWEDEIIKMKMCNINIVSTYVFWIHHEEIENKFDFEGRRNLKKFIEVCDKHNMYVIVRIGPFAHGEVRNGGIPDWLYGKPCEIRSLDNEFLKYTERWYTELAKQMKGLYYKDGGPIIAIQLDNEYMHSAAPWEFTTGISNEWLSGGKDGIEYMKKLKQIAIKVGIETPFYTCTGWGDTPTDINEMLPLWGGYSFRPWLFYSHSGKHPATEEYIYCDNHNNSIKENGSFKPHYNPEEIPYACCEMGGGMMCSYNYRFKLPYESVDAMANIKIASGCNFLGYYMFKGGTNPHGKTTNFLNEGQVPKLSYDYQAALGEYGQLRLSYKRLKLLHMFTNTFEKELCDTKTVLSNTTTNPEDVETLRYSLRLKDKSGFVFINNYQDHIETKDKKDCSICIDLGNEVLNIDHFDLSKDENCILPFNIELDCFLLKYSTAQLITYIESNNKKYYFFFMPYGMKPTYTFESKNIDSIEGIEFIKENDTIKIIPPADKISNFSLANKNNSIEIITLTREQSLNLYKCNINNTDIMFMTDGTLIADKNIFKIETDNPTIKYYSFPDINLNTNKKINNINSVGIFKGYQVDLDKKILEAGLKKIGDSRYTINFSDDLMTNIKDVLLQIDYIGDIGNAFIDGYIISDNFCNGDTWEIGLSEFADRLKNNFITIYINPIKQGNKVNVESSMAARIEETNEAISEVQKVRLKPIYELSFFI